MRAMIALVLCTVVTLCGGCATFVTGAGPDQKVSVRSTPNGANVFVDGQFKGTTPTSIAVTRIDKHTVRVEREGFEPYVHEMEPGANPWLLGNIPLLFLFIVPGVAGAIIDVLDGAYIWVGGDIDAKLRPDRTGEFGTPPQPTTAVPAGGYRYDRGAGAPRSTAPNIPRAGPTPRPSSAAAPAPASGGGSRLPQRRPVGAN